MVSGCHTGCKGCKCGVMVVLATVLGVYQTDGNRRPVSWQRVNGRHPGGTATAVDGHRTGSGRATTVQAAANGYRPGCSGERPCVPAKGEVTIRKRRQGCVSQTRQRRLRVGRPRADRLAASLAKDWVAEGGASAESRSAGRWGVQWPGSLRGQAGGPNTWRLREQLPRACWARSTHPRTWQLRAGQLKTEWLAGGTASTD